MSELTPDEVRRRRLARLETAPGAGLQSPVESPCKCWYIMLHEHMNIATTWYLSGIAIWRKT